MTPSTTTLPALFSEAKAGPPESPKHAVPPGTPALVDAALPQNNHAGLKVSETRWQESGSAASICATRRCGEPPPPLVELRPYPAIRSALPEPGRCSASRAGV